MSRSTSAAQQSTHVPRSAAVQSLGFLDQLPCLAFVEKDGVIVARNRLASQCTGIPPAEATTVDRVFLGSHPFKMPQKSGLPLAAKGTQGFDCMLLRGQRRPLAIHGAVGPLDSGVGERRLIVALEGPSAATRAAQNGTFLDELLNAAPEAMAITRNGRLLHVNRQFTRLFGYPPQLCVGQEIDALLASSVANRERENILHLIAANGSALVETVRHTHDGTAIDVSMVVGPVPLTENEHGLFYTFRDIRPQKQAEARLHYAAMHDALTDLPNRALFLERLRSTLARLVRLPDRTFAIMFLDLDGFKVANDALGHRAGDALLCEIADRLRQCVRPLDTVARLGGDEFALLIEDAISIADVAALAERVQAAIRRPVELEAGEARVSASIGIKLVEHARMAPEEAIHQADLAMYRAKANGKARHEVYDEEMTSPALLERAC